LVGGQQSSDWVAYSFTSTPALQIGRAVRPRKSAILLVIGTVRPDIVTIRDSTHPSTLDLPQVHNRTDEWYSYRTNPSQSPEYTVLATLSETYIDDITPAYLSMEPDHPISWYHLFEGKARAWYTGMGHSADAYSEDYFVKHVTGGLEWVVGSRD
ncbi:hypothetical protein diail_1142, partial [Diaporthe ilicicola]